MNTQNFTCEQCGYSISDEFCVLSKLTQKKYYDLELMGNAEGTHSDWLPICFYCFNGMERPEEESHHDETKELSEDTLENKNDKSSSENIQQEKSNATISKLIGCPDCGKEVSRRAASCPNCGCPISELPEEQLKPVTQSYKQAMRRTLKCPTCQSTNVDKISKGKKLAYVAGFGILAPAFKKVRSQFECKSCGYKW